MMEWWNNGAESRRLEAPAYAEASAFVITSARQVGAAWGMEERRKA
jgi:hypothetical protein